MEPFAAGEGKAQRHRHRDAVTQYCRSCPRAGNPTWVGWWGWLTELGVTGCAGRPSHAWLLMEAVERVLRPSRSSGGLGRAGRVLQCVADRELTTTTVCCCLWAQRLPVSQPQTTLLPPAGFPFHRDMPSSTSSTSPVCSSLCSPTLPDVTRLRVPLCHVGLSQPQAVQAHGHPEVQLFWMCLQQRAQPHGSSSSGGDRCCWWHR